jgi:hypothetical protein
LSQQACRIERPIEATSPPNPIEDMITSRIQHILTSLIQVNWQALWLSALIVAIVIVFQVFGALPKAKYSRWRLGLLLTATLTPFLLCLWTWASAFVQTDHYPAPYLSQMMFPGAPRTMRMSINAERFVILSYCAWLLTYPLIVWSKAASVGRLLKRYADNPAYWATDEQNRQNEVWEDLLRRFSFWRRVRVIEIEEHAPMTVGFFRPVIVVPDGINETVIGLNEPERFRAVMAHELAHICCDSLWTLIHRFAVWIFPLPQVPVWFFNCLRKRFVRLQMETDQARHFIGAHALVHFDAVRHSWMAWRPLHRLLQLLRGLPDPATALVGVEFERHADFVAVRTGGADHDVLRETLLRAALWEAQAGELARALGAIVTPADRDRVLDRIQQSGGEFEALEDRLNDLPPDEGISLWAKICKASPFLAAGFPFAIAAIPMLVFLAETGSELTRPLAPGFAPQTVTQAATAPVPPPAANNSSVPAERTRIHITTAERPRQTTPSPSISVGEIVRVPAPDRAVSVTPSVAPPAQPTSINTSAQEAAQRVATFNEQQRLVQANLSLQQQANAAMQRQQNDFNRAQSALDSLNRSQSQLQTTKRSRPIQANFDKANQQIWQTTRFVDQAQAVQSSQMRQQTTIQNASRVDAQTQQAMRHANALNNTRAATPYIPPAPTALQRIYTPPPTYSYTPPRAYTPPPTYTPPHISAPSPTPYIPPPPRTTMH